MIETDKPVSIKQLRDYIDLCFIEEASFAQHFKTACGIYHTV